MRQQEKRIDISRATGKGTERVRWERPCCAGLCSPRQVGGLLGFSSVQFSYSVVSNSLWPHGLQHARFPCPSPTPGVYSNSCLLSRWCHPAISSSVVPFSSCPQSHDAFELWCWRRFLRIPWTARRSNQSILKEISPEYSLEGLMLKLKLQYFGHLMRRADSLEKTLMLERLRAGGEGEGRRWDGWVASSTVDESEQTPQNSEGQGSLVCCSPWSRKE